MNKTPSTIDDSIRTNDALYYYWYYWLTKPNVFSSERAMKLKEILEAKYGEYHPRSLEDDMKNVEHKQEDLIRLLLEIPANYYGIDYEEFLPNVNRSLFYHDRKQSTIKNPAEIARTFVTHGSLTDWNWEVMRVIEKARPKSEMKRLREFVEALNKKEQADDEISSLLKKLPKWARQAVEIIKESDGIKHNDLMTILDKKGLPPSYHHISKLFHTEYAKKYFDENIISDSAFYMLKITDSTSKKS